VSVSVCLCVGALLCWRTNVGAFAHFECIQGAIEAGAEDIMRERGGASAVTSAAEEEDEERGKGARRKRGGGGRAQTRKRNRYK
jgi:hypothetical protein